MDNFGKNRRPGGAVYELLTVDTSGDDEEVGKQEEQEQASSPLVAKVNKGKRRKHKSRKMQISGEGEGEASSLGLVSLGCNGLVIGSSGDVLSFKDLILPHPDDVLADLRLEPRINVGFGDASSKETPFKDSTQEFPFDSFGAAESGVLQPGQKSPLSTESLRNLATGLASPTTDLLLLKNDSIEERNRPILNEISLNLEHEIRPAIVDTNVIETSSIDSRLPEFRLTSPKDRLSGRTSPVATGINSLSGNSPRGGSQREPLFASGPVSTELRQRAVEKLPDPPVQENGVEGGVKPTVTRVVSFKKQKPDADPSYLGHVDVIEQTPGYRPQPRLPLSSYETPHLTEWERLMAANSECKCSILSASGYIQITTILLKCTGKLLDNA